MVRGLRAPQTDGMLKLSFRVLLLAAVAACLLVPSAAAATASATAYVSVSAGDEHTCGLVHDGTVRCWGTGGVLGDGTENGSTTPVRVQGISTASAVSAGGYHTCALLTDGKASCWGGSWSGQLGDGTHDTDVRTTPVAVTGLTAATAIAGGEAHTCALITGGTVRCWGNGDHGDLGAGTTSEHDTPVTVPGITTATAIAAGTDSTCAVLADGTVQCWGWNGSGQLGDGTQTDRTSPVAVQGITTARTIDLGDQHACAVLADHTVRCWGSGDYDQLGDSSSDTSATPVVVSGITDAIAVAGGEAGTCVLHAGATVSCWGATDDGYLGTGSLLASPTAKPVTGLGTVTSLSSGRNHACAVHSGGTLSCWGRNTSGQLGIGASAPGGSTPVAVPEIADAGAMSAGDGTTCTVRSGGTVWCWGANLRGQLGNGTSGDAVSVPAAASGLTGATSVSISGPQACALLTGGTVRCWGAAGANGAAADTNVPGMVTGITAATAIAVGKTHACALIGDGTVRCWGDDSSGQLGNGPGGPSTTAVPVTVTGITNAVAIDAGFSDTCAVLQSGTVTCWGWNLFGQLGDGSTADRSAPVTVPGVTNAIAVTVGAYHTCALLQGGAAKCWGRSNYGQLGDGTSTSHSTATAVVGLNDASSISAGDWATCAVRTGGTVSCWGQGGFAGPDTQDTPTTVAGVADATAVDVSLTHVCARSAAGTMSCWGDDFYGPFGDGNMGFRASPTAVLGSGPYAGDDAPDPPPPAVTSTVPLGATETSVTPPVTLAGTPRPTCASTLTATKVGALLLSPLSNGGKAARIGALRKKGYALTFTAPCAGSASVRWTMLSAREKGGKRRPKALLVAAGKVTANAGRTTVHIRLTKTGGKLLKHAKRQSLTTTATFTPSGAKTIGATKKVTVSR
jgi:alpha-tubulin suppressor-like RCC1 family protein